MVLKRVLVGGCKKTTRSISLTFKKKIDISLFFKLFKQFILFKTFENKKKELAGYLTDDEK